MPANAGLLTIWTDVDAAAQADFHEWYDREHLKERAEIPGFRNARRYRAEGSPQFVAAYDTDTLAALNSPVYQKALANQSAWSKRVFPSFRDTVRVVGEVLGEAGGGYGGWMLPLRCMPLQGKADVARKALAGDLAARLVETPGIVRVVAVVGNVAALQVFGSGACDNSDPTRAVLLVEGSDPAALDGLNHGALSDRALEQLGLGLPGARLIYTLQYAVTR
jgi:hypothetical protein